jgi:hypothetical protein
VSIVDDAQAPIIDPFTEEKEEQLLITSELRIVRSLMLKDWPLIPIPDQVAELDEEEQLAIISEVAIMTPSIFGGQSPF